MMVTIMSAMECTSTDEDENIENDKVICPARVHGHAVAHRVRPRDLKRTNKCLSGWEKTEEKKKTDLAVALHYDLQERKLQ